MLSIALALVSQLSSPVVIETLRDAPEEYRDRSVRVCGELSEEGDILFSDVHLPRHGRLGIRLGENILVTTEGQTCVEGIWMRDPKLPYSKGNHIIITDAAVHPYYVLMPTKR
ncbi:MAG: hypothetical protein WBA51_14710 [Erythrobacter sp.]